MIPPIRARSLTDEIDIPPKFWTLITTAEFKEIFGNGGYLNREQIWKLWQMLERDPLIDPLPDSFGPIVLLRSDVEDRWPNRSSK